MTYRFSRRQALEVGNFTSISRSVIIDNFLKRVTPGDDPILYQSCKFNVCPKNEELYFIVHITERPDKVLGIQLWNMWELFSQSTSLNVKVISRQNVLEATCESFTERKRHIRGRWISGGKNCIKIDRFCNLDLIRNNPERYLRDGALYLQCRVTIYHDSKDLKIGKTDLGSQLLSSPELTDFKIKCKHEEFLVHRAVLALKSDVFSAMFTNNGFREATSNELTLDDTEVNDLKLFLQFIYTGSLNRDDYRSTELLRLADKYNVSGLKNRCENALAESLNFDNALHLLACSHRFSAETLREDAADFVASNQFKIRKIKIWRPEDLENDQAFVESIVRKTKK